MVTPPQNTAKTVNELVAMAKAKPGQLSYASYGAGGAGHIASEMILSMGGVVAVDLRGSCSGCPSSMVTLKGGIENLLKQMVPGVREVVAVEL